MPEKMFSALFIGPTAVGKTTLINNLMNYDNPGKTRPSIGATINRHENIIFYDWSGTVRYQSFREYFYETCDAVVIVLDDQLFESDAFDYINTCLIEINELFHKSPQPKLCLMINKKNEEERFSAFIDQVALTYPNIFSIINYCSLIDKMHRTVILKQIAKLCLLSHTEKLQRTNPSLFATEVKAHFLSREPCEDDAGSINPDAMVSPR